MILHSNLHYSDYSLQWETLWAFLFQFFQADAEAKRAAETRMKELEEEMRQDWQGALGSCQGSLEADICIKLYEGFYKHVTPNHSFSWAFTS